MDYFNFFDLLYIVIIGLIWWFWLLVRTFVYWFGLITYRLELCDWNGGILPLQYLYCVFMFLDDDDVWYGPLYMAVLMCYTCE